MRSVHVRTSCGCSLPGIAKALDGELQKRAAAGQGATPGRRQPKETRVGRYANAKTPALARALKKTMRAHAKATSSRAARIWAERTQKLAKDDPVLEAIRRRILEALDADGLAQDVIDELEGPMLAAFKAAAAAGAIDVGFSIDDITEQVDKAAVAYAARHGGELIADLAGTTEEAMSMLVATAVAEGMSAEEFADAIEELGAFGEARAETIARTELARAHVQGNVEGWRAAGDQVAGKRWVLADTHPVPDECDEAADAGVVDLEDDFVDGIDFPPAHPNCLCDVQAVLTSEDGSEDITEDDSSEDEEP